MWKFELTHYNCPTDADFSTTRYVSSFVAAIGQINEYKWIRKDCPMGNAKVRIRKVK